LWFTLQLLTLLVCVSLLLFFLIEEEEKTVAGICVRKIHQISLVLGLPQNLLPLITVGAKSMARTKSMARAKSMARDYTADDIMPL
jgi:hypothetical protein